MEIIEALRCVTKLSENEPYDKFITRVKENPLAVAVKLNDLTDNMDIRRLPYISDKDVKRLKKYLKAYKQLTGTPTYSVFACQQEYPNAYKPWTEEDNLELTQMWLRAQRLKNLLPISSVNRVQSPLASRSWSWWRNMEKDKIKRYSYAERKIYYYLNVN